MAFKRGKRSTKRRQGVTRSGLGSTRFEDRLLVNSLDIVDSNACIKTLAQPPAHEQPQSIPGILYQAVPRFLSDSGGWLSLCNIRADSESNVNKLDFSTSSLKKRTLASFRVSIHADRISLTSSGHRASEILP